MRIPSLWLAFSFALVFSGNLADSPVGKVVELGRRAIAQPFLPISGGICGRCGPSSMLEQFSLQAVDCINL